MVKMTTVKELEARLDELDKAREELAKEYSQFVPIYLFIKTNCYIEGVHALQEKVKTGKYPQHPLFSLDDSSKIARPLTFRENMEAMVNDYNTLKDENGRKRTEKERLKLFTESWKDSCTGIAYKAKSTKFKIIPVCKELVILPRNFNKKFLLVNYDSIQGTELDSSKGKYNQLLPQRDVLEHEAWITCVEDDKHLLKEYSDIVYSQLKEDAMGFYARQNTETDRLDAVDVFYFYYYSNANVNWSLNDDGRFLLVARENFSKGNKQ